MTYIPADQSPEGEAQVICQSKDGTTTKTFHALDWLAHYLPVPDLSGEVNSYMLYS